MSDVTPSVPQLNPVDVFFALGSDVRWAIIKMLADGKPRAAAEVAVALGRDFDGVSKHLRLMRECGVVSSRTGADRRLTEYFIPPQFRAANGVLDFGVGTVQMPTAVAATLPKD